MDKYHLHWFTDEIHMHASTALASYSHLLELVNDKRSRQSREVWFVLLTFLTHAAIVSKLLDPIGSGDNKSRGKDLRAHLQVPDDSAILPRGARDNLEHIDERIDTWVRRGDIKILEIVLDNREGFEYLCEGDIAIRRVLIRDEMVFISEDRNGHRLETLLQPVFESLKALHAVCVHKLQTESPYSYLLAQALLNHVR